MGPVLLVTATPPEAQPLREALPWLPHPFPLGKLYQLPAAHLHHGLYLAHLGVAKVNTAAGLALALRLLNPTAVVQFGVGGAFVGSGLELGEVAVAESEVHMDTGVRTDACWQGMETLGFPLLSAPLPLYNLLPTDPALSVLLASSSGAKRTVFGTSETVTGSFAAAEALRKRFGVAVESMEGAAAAQVCAALGVPFAEIRGVSNAVGERNKARWQLADAVAAVNEAVQVFLAYRRIKK